MKIGVDFPSLDEDGDAMGHLCHLLFELSLDALLNSTYQSLKTFLGIFRSYYA